MLLSRSLLYLCVISCALGQVSAQPGPLRFRIAPIDFAAASGTTVQFSAKLSFFDTVLGLGPERDITNEVQWFSSNQSVATIDLHTGLATVTNSSGAPVTTTITAVSGPLRASGVLTVTPATLTSITVIPVNPSIPLGLTVLFAAQGHYSDGTSHNLTDVTTWNSATTSVARIDVLGNVQTFSQGMSKISATYNSLGGSSLLTVDPPVLEFITLAPQMASTIFGTPVPFKATGTFSDGSNQDISSSSTWSVNGTAGGTSIVGTISSTGLYSAPTTVPTPSTVNVNAANTSIASPTSQVTINHSVTLTWGAIPSVVGYNVYRAIQSGGPYTKLNSALLTTTQFTDGPVNSGSALFYVVTSMSTFGIESDDSNEASANIP